jgi:hypothetical protein
VTGRFLSPDPTIPDPAFTQSYNRYSYVNNNPLSFTDPSGFADDPQAYFQQEGGGFYASAYGGDPVTGSNIGGNNFLSAGLWNSNGGIPMPDSGDSSSGSGGGTGGASTGGNSPSGVSSGEVPGTSSAAATAEVVVSAVRAVFNAGLAAFNPAFLLKQVHDAASQTEWWNTSHTYETNCDYRCWELGQPPTPIKETNGQQVDLALATLTLAIPGAGLEEGGLLAAEGLVESTALTTYYPAANGFLGATSETALEVGTVIDRYGGSEYSRFFSPAGTPLAARSLPPQTAAMGLRSLEVLSPFTVESGQIAPAFGQLGLGIQYRSSLTLGELLQRGALRETGP